MKYRIQKMIVVLSCLLVNIFGCAPNGKTPSNDMLIIPDGYTRYDVSNAYKRKTEGFGTQFDTVILERINSLSTEEWQLQINRMKEMNLQNIRIRFYPEMYERGNDNNDPNVFDYESINVDFNSIEMGYLYKLLDACEENDVKVDLSWYGCRTTFVSEDGKISGSWLGGNFGQYQEGWIVAPRRIDENGNPYPGFEEFAESVSACLKYLTEVKKYTCVNEFSICPEPDALFDNVEKTENLYFDLIRMVDEKLKADGIRDKFQYSGPASYTGSTELYGHYLSNLKNIYDKATSSVYKFNHSSTNEAMQSFAKKFVEISDKNDMSWGVAESGSDLFVNALLQEDIETFDRALYMARLAINFANVGCVSMKYFVFSDCLYDGNVNQLGLFKFRNNDFIARPLYYSWTLLTKYTEYGSKIYPILSYDQDLCLVAFELPDGNWSYMIANTSNEVKKISIVNDNLVAKVMNYAELTGGTLPNNSEVIALDKIVSKENKSISMKIKANSFTVLSTKTY